MAIIPREGKTNAGLPRYIPSQEVRFVDLHVSHTDLGSYPPLHTFRGYHIDYEDYDDLYSYYGYCDYTHCEDYAYDH